MNLGSQKLRSFACIRMRSASLKSKEQTVNKVLFTDCYTWQNFRLRLLCLVNNCVESNYKTEKAKMKDLPCVTVGEQYFNNLDNYSSTTEAMLM